MNYPREIVIQNRLLVRVRVMVRVMVRVRVNQKMIVVHKKKR